LEKDCSAKELQKANKWEIESDEDVCDEDVYHCALKDAPADAKKLADKLQKTLGKGNLLCGWYKGKVFVIDDVGDGTCIADACLAALGIKHKYHDIVRWEDKDWSGPHKQFCHQVHKDKDLKNKDDKLRRVKAVTQIMVEELTEHFAFGFNHGSLGMNHRTPMIWGGRHKSDNTIVGYLA